MMAFKPVKQEKIWCFNVRDPQLHPKGFTIYKVTCKFFPICQPESLTEIICWKRYNDFKELFKVMLNLHKALHRRDEFPPFAKPKLFGRFDETVIEERRQSALSLLNFIGHQTHLYNSQHFKTFWEGGKVSLSGFHVGPIMRPSKLDILSDHRTASLPPDVVPIQESQTTDAGQPAEPDLTSPVSEISDCSQLSMPSGKEVKLLEGTWNFPQVPDNISLGSSIDVDEFGDTDADSPLATSLPDTDLSFFDPLKSDAGNHSDQDHDITQSASWLIQAKTSCANMDDIDGEMPLGAEAVNQEDGIPIDFSHGDGVSNNNQTSDVAASDHSSSVKGSRDDLTESCQSGHSDHTFNISEFDPLRNRSQSKVECGKGDIDLSRPSSISQGSVHSTSSVSSTPRSSRSVSRGCSATPSPRKQRSGTQSSVSTMDLGGKDDYIYLAANQICLAQECEANGSYETAFTCYKTGVGILLQGVQADNNKARRDAVRRKTAQYLIKAEDLYNNHLAKDSSDEWRWSGIDTVMSPALEIDPALAFVRGSISELRSFKVLGTVHKVILVMDKESDETYCIKTIHKASLLLGKKPTILPTSCPYMASLYKFYETDDAIYLLLQYASGGKLWTYIGSYILNSISNAYGDEVNLGIGLPDTKNIYSGQKTHSSDDSLIKQTENTSGTVTPVMAEEKKNLIIGPDTSDGHTIKFINQCSPEDIEQNCSLLDDSTVSQSDKKPDYKRFSSVSSDGFYVGDVSNLSLGTTMLDDIDQEDHFQDILNQTKPSLEKFSINSFDSDGFHRLDSMVSDHTEYVESIPEGNESSSKETLDDSLGKNNEEVFFHSALNQNETNLSQAGEQSYACDEHLDAEQIVQNSKELIKSVERILSESDCVGNSLTNLASEDTETDSTSAVLTSVEDNNLSPRSISPGRVTNESRDSAEASIYDLHRTPNDSDSSEAEKISETVNPFVCDTNSQDGIKNLCDNSQSVDTVPYSNVDVKSAIVDSIKDADLQGKLISKLSGNTASVNRLSLSRMNSTDLMTRSASFECDMKSPTKNRARAMSSLFEQFDSINPELVKLPESCIKRWAAEIICALSRLHEFGIICRDLKPDNILLGDRGHILLTYFSQLSQSDKAVDQRAVEQLYVAPEVCSISGYTEVCDWWSLGALLYELLVGKSLLHCHPGGINSHTQLHIPPHVSTEGQALLQELLHFNHRERLGSGIDGAEAIKAHPFFSDINWNAVENQ